MRSLCLLVALSGLWPSVALAAEPVAPPGFVLCTVREVVTLENGSRVVMLAPKGEDVTVPLFIGEAEANAIRMRMERQTAPRPMTHDLLETVIRNLGGKVTQVLIDDLKDNVYLGKIHISQGAKAMEIDARPSDSMALALGTGAPIYAARKVIDQAGVKNQELERPHRRERHRRTEPPASEKPDISL